MSEETMSGIAAVGGTFSGDTSVAKAPLPPPQNTVQLETVQTTVDSPATIISISSASLTAKSQNLPDANPDEVGRTLARLGSVNGFADVLQNFDWASLEKEYDSSYTENQ